VAGDKHLEHKVKIQNTGGAVRAGFGDLKEDVRKASQNE